MAAESVKVRAPQKLRFKVAWQTYCVGDVIEPPASLRDWLITAGYCERLENAEIEEPGRPAKLGAKAAKKLMGAAKDLLGA